jgi:hypothetical protein
VPYVRCVTRRWSVETCGARPHPDAEERSAVHERHGRAATNVLTRRAPSHRPNPPSAVAVRRLWQFEQRGLRWRPGVSAGNALARKGRRAKISRLARTASGILRRYPRRVRGGGAPTLTYWIDVCRPRTR